MGAEMQHGMCAEVLAQKSIEGRERVGGREALLVQQPHRIAFEAECGLDPHEDIAETLSEDMDGCAVALLLTRSGAPLSLDFLQIPFASDMVIGRNALVNVRQGAELMGIAVDDLFAQFIDVRRHVDLVTRRLH